MHTSRVRERETQLKVLRKDQIRDQIGGVTLTFAPDIEVPPRVPGDHIATFQKGHTQHILRFLVFLRWGRRGRCQKFAKARWSPALAHHPGPWSRGPPPCSWEALHEVSLSMECPIQAASMECSRRVVSNYTLSLSHPWTQFLPLLSPP